MFWLGNVQCNSCRICPSPEFNNRMMQGLSSATFMKLLLVKPYRTLRHQHLITDVWQGPMQPQQQPPTPIIIRKCHQHLFQQGTPEMVALLVHPMLPKIAT